MAEQNSTTYWQFWCRVSFLALLFLCPPPLQAWQSDDEEIVDAMVLIRQGNVEAGIDMLRRIGELGNAEAFFYLAEINRTGDVKEASEQVSMMYYRLASQMGNKKASLNLANILFFDGSGSRAEVEEALAIWQQYAMLGDIESIYLLGMLYWNGEGGQVPDPIRGYGLIWRAAEAGYPPAQETEPAMREQLNADAIAAGQTYASDFEVKGFDNKPLDIHLVTDQEIAIPEPDEVEKPTDWTTVWRLEVGFAMSREDTEALQKDIYAKKKGAVEGLHSEIIEAPNRPGLYRLLFGPIGGMQNAVSKCVDLKRGGFDCFAKPPR